MALLDKENPKTSFGFYENCVAWSTFACTVVQDRQ